MKKIFVFAALMIFCSSAAFAHPYEMFNVVMSTNPYFGTPSDSLADKYLNKFAKDVGQAIAGGSFGAGVGLDAFGFNLSLKMSYQQVTAEDAIVNKEGDAGVYYPIIQGEFALKEKLTGIARLSYSNDTYVVGGGLRYMFYEGYDYVPTVSFQSVYNYLIADFDDPTGVEKKVQFNLWNFKNSVLASFFPETPYVKPYVFVSFDVTGFHAVSSDRKGSSVVVPGVGYGAGGSIAINPINLNFTISMYDGSPNYNFGVFFGF